MPATVLLQLPASIQARHHLSGCPRRLPVAVQVSVQLQTGLLMLRPAAGLDSDEQTAAWIRQASSCCSRTLPAVQHRHEPFRYWHLLLFSRAPHRLASHGSLARLTYLYAGHFWPTEGFQAALTSVPAWGSSAGLFVSWFILVIPESACAWADGHFPCPAGRPGHAAAAPRNLSWVFPEPDCTCLTGTPPALQAGLAMQQLQRDFVARAVDPCHGSRGRACLAAVAKRAVALLQQLQKRAHAAAVAAAGEPLGLRPGPVPKALLLVGLQKP